MTKKKQKLVLIDAHAIIHRGYHALPDFTSSKGEPTGALYGLSSMLIKIIGEMKPDYVVAAYDLPEKTFRHEVYKEYKAGRKKVEDDLIHQLERSRDIFESMHIPIYDSSGFEADDMLGTIVEQLKNNKDIDTIIASGDLDTLQLVDNKRVQVYTLRRGITDTVMYDEDAVVERFGFESDLLPDYKGLRGDPSDNIIGVRGIGEKTATQLIVEFGTIENMYKILKKNPERFAEAGIKPRIVKLLEENEEEALFSKTLAVIRRDAPIEFSLPDKKWIEGVDRGSVKKLFSELSFRTLFDRFEKLFGDDMANGKEEKKESIDSGELRKTSIALWLLNSDISNPNLDDILDYANTDSFEEAKKSILKEIKEKNLTYIYENIELPIISIIKKMEEHGILLDLPYLETLSVEYHKNLEKIQKRIWDASGQEFNINSPKQLGEILYDKLDLGARVRKSPKGARSTRMSELEKLIDKHPIIQDIIDYRELQKLLSTYIDTLPKMVGEDGRLHAQFIQTGTTTGRFSSMNPNIQNIPIRSDLGKKIRNAFIAPKGYRIMSFDYSQIELRVAALLSQDKYLIEIFNQGKDIHAAVASRVFGVKEKDVTADMRRRAKVINFGIIYGMGVSALQKNLKTDRKEATKFYNDYVNQFPEVMKYLDGVKEDARRTGYTETIFGRRRYLPALKSKIPFIRLMAERMAINAPIQGAAADAIKLAIKDVHEVLKEKDLLDKAHLIAQVHDELVFEVKEEVVKEVAEAVDYAMEHVVPEHVMENREHVPIEVHVFAGQNWGEMERLD